MKPSANAHEFLLFAVLVAVVVSSAASIADNSLAGNGHLKQAAAQQVYPPLTTYAVTFSESGLALGVKWYVSILETDLNLQYNTLSSTSDTILFSGYPGNYSVQYWTDGNYVTSVMAQKAFTINGSPSSMNVTFYQTFPVTVEASDIPSNVSWGVSLLGNLTNQYMFGRAASYQNGSQQVLNVVNGTYNCSAGEQVYSDLGIYSFTGDIRVDGAPTQLNLSFGRLNLSASGLPENTPWGFYGSNSLTLPNGSMQLSHGLYPGIAANVTLYMPYGPVHIQPVAKGYYTDGSDPEITAGTTNATVHFQKEYAVTFNARGVYPFLQGWQWQVNGFPYTFEGTPQVDGASSSLTYMVPNGTYNASITFPYGNSNYVSINGTTYLATVTSTPPNENITVSGGPQTINLTFHTSYAEYVSPEHRSLQAFIIVMGTLGALGAAIVTVAAVEYLKKRK